jgi:hypothetical protein
VVCSIVRTAYILVVKRYEPNERMEDCGGGWELPIVDDVEFDEVTG